MMKEQCPTLYVADLVILYFREGVYVQKEIGAQGWSDL